MDLEDMGDRIPPHSLEAERAALGCMLIDPEAADCASTTCKDDIWYQGAHKLVFRAIRAMRLKGHPVDAVTVAEALRSSGDLERAGGETAIHALESSVPSAANLDQYLSIVRDHALRRQLIWMGESLSREAQEGMPGDVLQRAAQRILALSQSTSESRPVPAKTAADEAFQAMKRAKDHPKKVWGIPTGLTDLDLLTGGLQPGEMTVVGARASGGKTSMVLTWFMTITRERPALLFSAEMRRADIATRLVSSHSKVSFRMLKQGYSSDAQWEAVVDGAGAVANSQLWIDDTSGVNLAHVNTFSRMLRARKQIQLVAIDYLGLMETTKEPTREREMAKLSGGIKSLAKELNIPIVVLSQARKAQQGAENRRLYPDDLKDTGAIVHDADVVILLNRDRGEDGQYSRVHMVDVAKNRNGPIGVFNVLMDAERMTFVDMR